MAAISKLWRVAGFMLVTLEIVQAGGEVGHDSGADQAAFDTVCGACHPASAVNGVRTEPEWRETVEHMVSIGARGTDEQFDGVMRILQRTLTRININAATAAEMAPVLDLTVAAAQTVVKYRSERGSFKNLDDLKKVPGLDANKLDARKDRIVF